MLHHWHAPRKSFLFSCLQTFKKLKSTSSGFLHGFALSTQPYCPVCNGRRGGRAETNRSKGLFCLLQGGKKKSNIKTCPQPSQLSVYPSLVYWFVIGTYSHLVLKYRGMWLLPPYPDLKLAIILTGSTRLVMAKRPQMFSGNQPTSNRAASHCIGLYFSFCLHQKLVALNWLSCHSS